MKFTTAIIAAATIAIASAQGIQINNPTKGSKWTVGKEEYFAWTGTCANLGAAGKTTVVNLSQGPANTVQFIAKLGEIDCTGSIITAKLKVPDVPSGEYSLTVLTDPISYSPNFEIVNSAAPAPAPPAPATPTTPTTPTEDKKSAANSLAVSGSLMAVAGVIAALAL
ncbi:hypothetical protein BGZ94_002625 [Podila epigama]|nr:hypothetical protein BGZ94_002625 [Podila epigama]